MTREAKFDAYMIIGSINALTAALPALGAYVTDVAAELERLQETVLAYRSVLAEELQDDQRLEKIIRVSEAQLSERDLDELAAHQAQLVDDVLRTWAYDAEADGRDALGLVEDNEEQCREED